MNDLMARAVRHAALGDTTRLRIVDLLGLQDRSPGELMAVLGIASNLLGHHLGVLEEAGLVTRARSEGDRRRSYVHLLPEGSAFAHPGPLPPVPRVVFVCTGNSSRSPLAAQLWNSIGRIPAVSAGTHPAARVSDGAVQAAARHGVTMPAHTPTPLDEVLGPDDLVIAVCDRAYEELRDEPLLHWSVPNPAITGSALAYDQTFEDLDRRVRALAAYLP